MDGLGYNEIFFVSPRLLFAIKGFWVESEPLTFYSVAHTREALYVDAFNVSKLLLNCVPVGLV